MGRPKLQIDEARVAELAFQGASVSEIAAIVGCDDQTIHNRFSKLVAKKKAERRVAIRNSQTATAHSGDAALLIWLGKTELGQTDKATATPTQGYDLELDLSPPQGPPDRAD